MLNKLLNIKAGERVIYHTGNLAKDCMPTAGRQLTPANQEAISARRAAWDLFMGGKVELIQRVRGSVTDYIAVGRVVRYYNRPDPYKNAGMWK